MARVSKTKKATAKKTTPKKATAKKAKPKKSTGWYDDTMLARETALHEAFGPTSPRDQVILPTDESLYLSCPGFSILRFPRAKDRPFWLYVTHGLSQPARAADAKKGRFIGAEVALATPRSVKWPVAMLELIAGYLLHSPRPLVAHDRLPASDLMEVAPGGALLALADPGVTTVFETPRGTFELRVLVGTTPEESAAARALPGRTGSAVLEEVLRELGIGCVTDRKRACAAGTAAFRAAWRRAEQMLAT